MIIASYRVGIELQEAWKGVQEKMKVKTDGSSMAMMVKKFEKLQVAAMCS